MRRVKARAAYPGPTTKRLIGPKGSARGARPQPARADGPDGRRRQPSLQPGRGEAIGAGPGDEPAHEAWSHDVELRTYERLDQAAQPMEQSQEALGVVRSRPTLEP